MKVIKLFYLFTLLFALYSCESNIEENNKDAIQSTEIRSNVETFIRNGATYIAGDVNVTCGSDECTGGNVGPTDKCQVGSDLNGYFECTCAGCTMKVAADAVLQDHNILEQLHIDNNDENAKNFILEKHDEGFYGFQSVSYHFSIEKTIVIYKYGLKNGDVETVLYVNNYNEVGALTKQFEIDCTGSCGCREQYNHNTGISSCSCDECKMKVTEIE